MSQFSNGVVLQEMSLKTNPVIDTYGSVRSESDLFSTLVLNAGPGTIGYNTGLGFPTFTGLAAKSLAQGMFERDIASPAAAYYKDVPSNLTGDPKPMLAWYESTFPEIRKMKEETGFSFDGHDTAEDAYEAMALAYGNWKAQQYYSDPFSSGSSVAVGIASLGLEILGDPTTWIGAGLGKLAVQKATTKVAEKALATQLGRVAAEGAVTNAVQTLAQSVAGQQQRYDLWGVVPDSNIDTTAMIAGGLFGAMLPVSIAGGIHGIGSGLDASARYVDKNLGNPDSFVNKVARMAGAPVLRNESIDHLTGLGVAAENAEMVAGTHKYLYNDVTGNAGLEIALTKDYWDEVANTGIDAKQYASWGLRSKPSQDEAMAFLEGLRDEAQRIRDAEANGGQSPAVAKANKDLQEVTLKVDNAFVDVEDPEIANRGTAWALVNIKRQLIAGGSAPDVAAEQSLSLMALIAAKAASKDMGTDEWIARNIKNFTIDRNPKTGETLFSIRARAGSGDADFTNFSLDYMGSGEGTQWEGWGLYFSDQYNIAATYRDIAIGGKPNPDFADAVAAYKDAQSKFDSLKAKYIYNGEVDWAVFNADPLFVGLYDNMMKAMRALDSDKTNPLLLFPHNYWDKDPIAWLDAARRVYQFTVRNAASELYGDIRSAVRRGLSEDLIRKVIQDPEYPHGLDPSSELYDDLVGIAREAHSLKQQIDEDLAKGIAIEYRKLPGAVREVDLDLPNDMFTWGLTVKDQPQSVQYGLWSLFKQYAEPLMDVIRHRGEGSSLSPIEELRESFGSLVSEDAASLIGQMRIAIEDTSTQARTTLTSPEFPLWELLSDQYRKSRSGGMLALRPVYIHGGADRMNDASWGRGLRFLPKETAKELSKALQSVGIDGWRYKGSNKKGGYYNYVVWNTDKIKILETYTQKNPATGVVQAAVSFSPVDGRAIIRAFTGATNFSSMVHELGHIFRRDLDPDQLAAANRWVGATAGTKWTTKQEEQFARGFEKWLRGRKNTGSPMDGVFQKMKNWMLGIYQTIKGSPLDHVRLNDEIVNVFESMFRKGNGTVELTSPASGPPVAKFGLGRVKLRIAGDIERALFALHKTKTQKDRYALVTFLRKHTGMSDNEILTASRFVWSEVRSKVREAKSKLRATNRPADVRVDTNGSPYVVVELGDLKKIYDPEELGALRFKEKFSNIGAPTTIETLQAELAAIRDEQAKLEYSDDAEKIAAVRKMKNKAARKLAHAVEKFFPNASGRTGSAAVVGDIDSGIVEKTAGTKLDSTETARVMLDGARKGNLNGDWLVFNSTRAIKGLRKLGNFFSTGHLETVGSDNPIVAKLARLVSEGIIYRDAFGPTKFKAIGLEQHRHRVKAMAGEAIREIEAVLKDVDPAIHQEVTKMAVARASGATYAGLSDPAATSAAEAMAAVYTKIYNRFGVEGIQNGYFRNTIDNYGGTFHILGTKRKASELADALYSVWREHFTKEDAPIHRRTFKSIPSISLEAYPQGGPKILADLLPDDRAKYLKALLDESVRDGIYTSGLKREAQLVANNKLGFTELKELIVDDSLGLVHSDPSLSRQINVDVWFDPRVSGFVDWDPYGNIQKYLEITGYRVKEQTDINKVVKELLGYDRRDVDAIGLVRGIRDLLLSDDKLVDADREILKQSFQYLENQVNVLRSHVNRDYSRQMGAMDTVANVTMNLGRTGVSARSAMAGLSTEIIPMLLATTFRHPKNILPILKSTLQGLSKWQLKGLMAGYNHMFTHRPDVLNHVADIPSINHSWLDKTFINPYKQLKAATQTGDATKTRIGNILTSATSMLHRMSSGLGGEDFFQKMATNVAAMQTTYRIADKFEKMKKLAAAMDGYSWSDDVTVREKQFRKLAYDNGFGEDTAWAAKLNQAGLLEKDFVSAMDAINTASDGRLLNDPNGAFDQNLIERIIGTNAENARFYEAMNDRLLRFVEADIKTRVTTPGVQDSNIPAGGLDPITRMAQMFMSFQRSWFHHVLLNGVSNSKLQYGLSFLGTMLVGELIYYHAYRMLYRGDSWEDLEEEWTENPSVMIVEAVGRTNLFGSASAIGQHVLDIVSDSGAARGGSIYSLKVAGNLFQSSVNLTKAALGKEDVDPADARRIELMTGGLNAWWVRPLMQATGYDSFSEWIFRDQPAG